jgi:hypothetical protein
MVLVVAYSYVIIELCELPLQAAGFNGHWPPGRILQLAGGVVLALYAGWSVGMISVV